MLSLLVVAALVPSLQRPCTEDANCDAGWTCRLLLKTPAVFPERGECFDFKVCTKKSQVGEECGGLVQECETNVCMDGLDCTFNGHQPGTCATKAEVWEGLSSTPNSAGVQEVCTLTVEKDANGETTLMRLSGWGKSWGFSEAENFGRKEVVVTADNTSDGMKESVSFDKTLSFKHWGFHNIAWEETKPKWTWDFSKVLGILIREPRYIAVKDDYEKLVARSNIYLLGRTAAVGNVEIDCEGLKKVA